MAMRAPDAVEWAMKRYALVVLLLGAAIAGPCAPRAEAAAPPTGTPVLLPRAHAHNDYLHDRPLLDALSWGFCSVEADIWLVDGALLVAHERSSVDPRRTLEALYLRPLQERFLANRGSVYPEAAPFTLLIDIKNTGADTFRALDRVLASYDAMLTHFTDDTTTPGAVTVIVSGERDLGVILGSSPRRAGIDGRLADLDGPLNRHQMPLVSDNWLLEFRWNGRGAPSAADAAKLAAAVTKAHDRGMRIRFWSIPQTEAVWSALYDAGVDLLNADDLGGLNAVLSKKSGE
jgi:hypothetical protein